MLPPPSPSPPSLTSPESVDRHSLSYSPSLLIIAGLLAFAVVAIASIHLLLRYLSRSRNSSSSSPSSLPPPFLHHHHHLSSSSSAATTNNINQEEPAKNVIDSLPLFTLSAAATASSSSLDCAVCLSPFEPRDQLRLLPSCRHAFHSHCIDTWLRSTLSCPLCRSSVHPPPPPPPPAAAAHPEPESFRVEIGSVSRRTATSADENPNPPPPHVRTYSLGSSFEYLVEEEVEAVISRIRRPEKSGPPYPPGETVAQMAGGGGGGSRNWLSDYVDRLVSSASSSFSSLRWSRRFDSGGAASSAAAVGGAENWELERNLHLHLEEEEDGGFSSFYRWLLGA